MAAELKDQKDSLDPLRLLQDDLQDEDHEQVIKSASRITTIARAIGPERTRKELIPFLLEFSEEDNDEAHTAIARQLGDFVPLVGGTAHGKVILPLLEKLCGEEEVVVRDAAVKSLNTAVHQLAKEDIHKDYLSMIQRLAGSPWFATRVSAAGIVPQSYGAASDPVIQEELRRLFACLCKDETPMVRKAAYHRLGEFAALVKQHFKTDILPVVKELVKDPSDTMRQLTVDVVSTVGETMPTSQFEVTCVPIIEALEDDSSWRVRQALARKMPKLCKDVSPAVAQSKLLPLVIKLVKDKEAEVRSVAAAVLADVGTEVKGSEVSIIPCLEDLSKDSVQTVRVNVAKSMVHLCRRFPKEPCSKVVIPLLRNLAKDDSSEVRSCVINEIDKLADYIDPSALLSVFPLMLELSKDAKWRVRAAVIDKSSVLAKHLGVKKFEKQLQSVILSALSDHVFAIREKACTQIGLVVKTFGGKWAAEKLFPSAFSIYDKNANYLYRMTCLLLIQNVAPECPPDVIDKHLLPLVFQAAVDDVPNVRVAASKTLGVIAPRMDPKTTKAKLGPIVAKLLRDTDGDVLFYANRTFTDNRALL